MGDKLIRDKEMKIYIFGNGNISYSDFEKYYINSIKNTPIDAEYYICDFRGTDTLAMEYLKTITSNVTILHIGDKPRYLPDRYKTKVSSWKIIGGFENDQERDDYAIDICTHYIAMDQNSNEKRKSGTLSNIEKCEFLNKLAL